MGLFSWLLGGIKDFLGGMISEFFNWLVECVVQIADKIGEIFDAILGLFGFIPLTFRLFGRLGRSAFWFLPDAAFSVLEVGIAVICIIVLVKTVLRMLGR